MLLYSISYHNLETAKANKPNRMFSSCQSHLSSALTHCSTLMSHSENPFHQVCGIAFTCIKLTVVSLSMVFVKTIGHKIPTVLMR